MNTWPDGVRRAMTQSDHEHWNASIYPGTRQRCFQCDAETGRCEEDDIWSEDRELGLFCEDCWVEYSEGQSYDIENGPCVKPKN